MTKENERTVSSNPDLIEAYYLENLQKVLDFVEGTYSDLLLQQELRFLQNFNELSENAKRLLVRLSLRSKLVFREDKLSYDEIDISSAAKELSNKKLLAINPELHFEDYSSVFTVKELIEFGKSLELGRITGNRTRVLELLEEYDEELFEQVCHSFKIYLLLEQERIDKFLFLFFGNLFEDLSHFILEDLGVRRYEKIVIDNSSRLFQSKAHIRVALELSHLHSDLWIAVESEDEDEVGDIVAKFEELRCPKALKKKLSRSLNLAARFYERKGELDEALFLFSKSCLAPARERIARILEKQGEYDQAMTICQKIMRAPQNSDELSFAQAFKEVLKRKLGLNYEKRKKAPMLEEEILPLKWDSTGRVEEQVLSHLEANENMKGFFCENVYWCTLSVLLFWDEFWQADSGAFYHPFEGAPRDFSSGEFFIRQSDSLAQKAAIWQAKGSGFYQEVLKIYDEKFGTYCDLINWKKVNKEHLETLLKATPIETCLALSLQIMKSPKEYRSGLPDLFLSYSGGFLLGEVKSPRDQVQNSQKRWFKFFSERGIPYTIYRVPE